MLNDAWIKVQDSAARAMVLFGLGIETKRVQQPPAHEQSCVDFWVR